MSAFPGLKAIEAADALAAYLDQAGIVRTEDRIVALRRHYADIHDGRDLLIERMEGL